MRRRPGRTGAEAEAEPETAPSAGPGRGRGATPRLPGRSRRGAGTAALAAAGLALAVGSAACSSGGDPLSEAARRGKAVYAANCTACHAADPNLDGAIGPAIAGSSRALVEARVLRAGYPPGYTPKRDSHAMVALPQLAGSIGDLTAYLDEVAR